MQVSLQASIPKRASLHDPEIRLPSNGNLIRLARLNPSPSSQDIPSITLEVYDLDRQLPAYNALSYTWSDGNASSGETFSVLSTATSTEPRVTANLYWALKHLRLSDEPRYLWIDQICIRQDDLAEKSHQIPLMGRIYREAPGGVIAWLGEYGAMPSINYDHLLQYMSFVTRKDLWTQSRYLIPAENRALDFLTREDTAKGWKSLIAFLTHTSWFMRVWIVQEASAQKDRLLFQISNIQFSFLDLCQVVEATNYDMRASDSAVKRSLQHPDGRTTYFRFLRACPAIDVVGTVGTHNLQSLVQTFCDWTASEPRDKVYAFLGLASDAPRYSRPNYNLPIATVYREYAEVTLADNILPDVLSALTFAVLGETLEGQPSWVTNWASFQAGDSYSQQKGTKSALWPARNNFKFQAGGRMERLDEYRFKAGVLRLRGVHVDRVARVTSIYPGSGPSTQIWLEEALHIMNDGNEMILTLADIASLLVMDGQSSLHQLSGNEPSWLHQALSASTHSQALHHAGYNEYSIQIDSLCASPRDEGKELRLPSNNSTKEDNKQEGTVTDLQVTRASVYRETVSAIMMGRCLFVTEQGRVGAADARIRGNDTITVFKGSRLPFVVRWSTNQSGHRLISEAFTRGIMHGEALGNVSEFVTMSIAFANKFAAAGLGVLIADLLEACLVFPESWVRAPGSHPRYLLGAYCIFNLTSGYCRQYSVHAKILPLLLLLQQPNSLLTLCEDLEDEKPDEPRRRPTCRRASTTETFHSFIDLKMASKELYNGIDRILLERLQSVVKQVCDKSLEARELFEEALLTEEKNKTATSQESAGKKRPRYVLCQNCKEEFDVSQNAQKSCKFHPGNLEVDDDSDFWADHDEDCHGTIDTDEMREEFPDGFRWDCCEANGKAAGCETGAHEHDAHFRPESKRPKVWN